MSKTLDLQLEALFGKEMTGNLFLTRLQDYKLVRSYFVWKRHEVVTTTHLRDSYIVNVFLSNYMRDRGDTLFRAIKDEMILFDGEVEPGTQAKMAEDGFAAYLEERFDSMRVVIDNFVKYPFVIDEWQKIFNPSVFETDTLPDTLREDDVIALVYSLDKGKSTTYLKAADRRWLSENVAYSAFVNAQVNPDRIKLLLFGTISEEEASRMSSTKVYHSIIKGSTIILFYKMKVEERSRRMLTIFKGAYTAIDIDQEGRIEAKADRKVATTA